MPLSKCAPAVPHTNVTAATPLATMSAERDEPAAASAAQPRPQLSGTRVQLEPTFPWRAQGRTGLQAVVYHTSQVAVLLATIGIAVVNAGYRIGAVLTGGLLSRLLAAVQTLLAAVLARVLGARAPGGRPISLVNAAEPNWVLPAAVDEASATIFLARLAYEDGDERAAIAAEASAASQPAVTVASGDISRPSSTICRHASLLGRRLAAAWFGTSDTQAFLGKHGDTVVVVFRGTEPLSLVDWSTDFNLDMEPTRGLGRMHRGFKAALGIANGQDAQASLYQALCDRVAELQAAGQGSDSDTTLDAGVAPPELLVTGHSLGAALAATFAAHYMRDHPAAAVRAYPYAQPRVGDAGFAQALERLVASSPRRVFRRFVNNNDIVTRVPASLFGFRHEPAEALEGGCEAIVIAWDDRLYRLPRGYWSEHPPLQRWTAARKTRARFNSESTMRWLLRLPEALLQPVAWYSLFINDHFPMDYQRAVHRAQAEAARD